MTTQSNEPIEVIEVRQLMEERAQAVRNKRVDISLSRVGPGIVSFDVVNPLQYLGAAGSRKRMEEWFGSFDGPIGYEQRDLTVAASENVAFCHSLNHVDGTRLDGTKLEMWWRATVCWRKIDGEWLITHEHSSVPFDVATGLASMKLVP